MWVCTDEFSMCVRACLSMRMRVKGDYTFKHAYARVNL